MSSFDIKDQVRLPISKCVELVLSGIQFRLFRASVTVAIVTLAVAFLMTILGDSFVGRSVADSLPGLTQPRRTLTFWVQRLSRNLSEPDLMATVLASRPGDARWAELKSWAACADEPLAELKEVAVKEDLYLRFFLDLKEGQLRRLAGRARGREILQALQAADALNTFSAELPGIGKQLPGTLEDFQGFVGRWAAVQPLVQKIIEGHRQAQVQAKSTLFKTVSVNRFLASMDAPTMEKLNALGFRMTADEIPVLTEKAREQLMARAMEQVIRSPVLKQKIANRYGIKDLNKVTSDLIFDEMQSKREAQWLLDACREIKEPLDMTADNVRQTSESRLYQRRLADIEASVEATTQQTSILGFPPRVMWLITVSLIVCIVGITNAMLMSVTERFKEIATMKCLGATDGFIMVNFILESGFQGLAGGVIGSLLGTVLGILRSSLTYGTLAFQNIPYAAMLALLGVAIAAGIILSIVAAIYPAYVAARLAPMEAMRVE